MKTIFLKGLINKSADGSGYTFVASTNSIDRQGDSIDQKGWDITNFMKNPVILFAHDYSSLPVGKATSIELNDTQMKVHWESAPVEANPVALQVKNSIDGGFLNAMSVGFIPTERNGNTITKAELLEISVVPVPANAEALQLAVKSGQIDITDIKAAIEKGEVADVLTDEENTEMKYEKWEEVMEAISAMWTVYFKPETAVEDFGKLLEETIVLLQDVVANDGIDADDEEGEDEEEKTVKTSPEATAKFMSSLVEKAGRTHSAATIEKMKKALEHATNAKAVMEEMISSACNEDGKSIEENGSIEKEEVKDDTETTAAVLNIRSLLKLGDQNNELAIRLVNGLIEKKKLTK